MGAEANNSFMYQPMNPLDKEIPMLLLLESLHHIGVSVQPKSIAP
jgi:hypothetical protein